MSLNAIEKWTRRVGGLAMLAPLIAILIGIRRGLRRPRGRAIGRADAILQRRVYLLIGAPYFGCCILLWRPIRVTLPAPERVAALILGALLYFPGLALALWGRLALGEMYNVSSGFGVQMYADQRLITRGPYTYVRHPIYLGLLLAAWGGLLLYRTWTLVFLVVNAVTVLVVQ